MPNIALIIGIPSRLDADNLAPSNPCSVCGTWLCDDCGARRPHANRFSSQPQLCPQCSSASGCMTPVSHRAGRADDHEAAFRQCIAEGLPLRYPLSVSS